MYLMKDKRSTAIQQKRNQACGVVCLRSDCTAHALTHRLSFDLADSDTCKLLHPTCCCGLQTHWCRLFTWFGGKEIHHCFFKGRQVLDMRDMTNARQFNQCGVDQPA